MGMAGGAYKGDKERAQLALQAQQIANQNAQARQNAALRQQELEQREKSRAESKALAEREMAFRQEQQQWDNAFKQQRQNADIAHLQTQDKIALRADERADEVLQQRYAQQSQVYGGYQQLAKQARAQQEQRQALGQSAVASVMKLAMYSGGKDPKTGATGKGMVPMYALQALNRDMGFDGENQGFVSGGYTQNGDFFLQFARKDPQTGQMVTQPQVLKPMDQYRVMNQQQGIFDNNDRGTMAAQLKQAGFRDNEILLASGINQTQLEQMRKLASAKQVQGDTLKDRLAALSAIKSFMMSSDDPTKFNADLDEDTLAQLKAAYANGIQGIASQFATTQPKRGGRTAVQSVFLYGDTQGGAGQGEGAPDPAQKPGAAQGRGETQPDTNGNGKTQGGAAAPAKATSGDGTGNPKPGNPKEATPEERKKARERLEKMRSDREWGATTLADGYRLGDVEDTADAGITRRRVYDKDGKLVGAVDSDGRRAQLVDGSFAEVADDADASWQDEGRTSDELKRRFEKAGGRQSEDGSFELRGIEFLNKEKRMSLGKTAEGISRKLVRTQEQIAKNRAAFEKRRADEEADLRKDAKSRYRGNDKGLEKFVKAMMDKWDAENDPRRHTPDTALDGSLMMSL